jgi:hypothetical protein
VTPVLKLDRRTLPAPALRLAVGALAHSIRAGIAGPTLRAKRKPALLCSYAYLEKFEPFRAQYHMRDWVMDSGAFSVHNAGHSIRLQDYIDCCKRLFETDPYLTEVYSLDIIRGDWREGVKNAEEMWRQGVQCVPCYHFGEPVELLKSLARDYPKIAFGGTVGLSMKQRLDWYRDSLQAIWPARVHGFGCTHKETLTQVPLHSCDSTTWVLQPERYGMWGKYRVMSVRNKKGTPTENLKELVVQANHYLEMEEWIQFRWKREMKELEALPW